MARSWPSSTRSTITASRRSASIARGQLRRQLAEAQLKALQRQLHPHFLFNTLNTISALMHRDVHAADEMLGNSATCSGSRWIRVGTQQVPLTDGMSRHWREEGLATGAGMGDLGRTLMLLGGVLLVVGARSSFTGRRLWVGRLPGDSTPWERQLSCFTLSARHLDRHQHHPLPAGGGVFRR